MGTAETVSLPLASLIVCSRNRPGLLAETVESILHGNEVPAELIIVDQSDSSHPFLASLTASSGCKIRYVWIHSRGKSRASNVGIAASCYPILIFTDDDVLVAPTWLKTIVQTLVNAPPRSVVTGEVRPTEPNKSSSFVPSTKVDPVPAVYQGRSGQDVLFGNNWASWRSALDEVGKIDERLGPGTSFAAAEDNDLGFRLLEAGYRIIYVPEAIVHHRAWRSDRDYLALRWSYARGQGAFFAKYLSLYDRYMLRRMVKSIKDHLLGFIWNIRDQRRVAYGNAVYILGLLSGAAQWLLTQRVTDSMKKWRFQSEQQITMK
jgi:GT2 family glycosyltransferase